MPWLKLLHITAVIVWCGALLYLPAWIAAATGAQRAAPVGAFSPRQLLRTVFTLVATPAALLAIASGTAIFALQGPLSRWLMAKLGAVALLVLAHGACGMLVLRAERHPAESLVGLCRAVGATVAATLLCVAWLALGKPF